MSNQKYDKVTQREHILLRPGMYIGHVKKTNEPMWLYEKNMIAKRDISFIPGLYKIFDEIIVNARDHSVNDKTCNSIEIEVNVEDGYFSVYNNGDNGIPVKMHEKHKVLIPSMIFGELLTSSNYDDSKKRTTGGLNGLGSKVCSVWSKKFEVEVQDKNNKKHFHQIWEDNMSKINPAKVKSKSTKSFVKVTCYPDLERFKLKSLKTHLPLFQKRAYDLALTTEKVKVKFNGEEIKLNKFQDFMDLYFPETDKIVDTSNPRMRVGCLYYPDVGHETISYVNGICTYRGGTHCNYVVDMVVKSLINDYIKKKNKDVKVTPAVVKDNLVFFIDSVIDNPSFSSQSKETLTTKPSEFGTTYELNKSFMNKLSKSGIVQQIISLAKFKESNKLNKTDGKKTSTVRGIPKLEDANKAGTKDAHKCALFLAEGDSALSMILSGLSSKDRNYYGAFPLKGKLLNVREASVKQIMANEEITNLKKIIGLRNEYKYEMDEEFNTLRYGKVIALTDQDSVTGNTPLLLKNKNTNTIIVKQIEDIFPEDYEKTIYNKEIGLNNNYEIWTDSGWTDIKKVIRHKVTKNIYRVLTHSGCVDVTEDHSLLKIDGTEIAPKDCKINDKLLHNFPIFENKYNLEDLENKTYKELWTIAQYYKIPYYQSIKKNDMIELLKEYITKPIESINYNNDISEKEAYLMGLFFAEGCCDVYTWQHRKKPKNRPREYLFTRTNYTWAISNNNLELLEKMKDYCSEIYPEHNFTIFLSNKKDVENGVRNNNYKLNLNGGKKAENLIRKYRDLFYNKDRLKKVPEDILNAPINIVEQFFEGYYEGDGFKARYNDSKAHMGFDFYGKEGALGLYFICKRLGYLVSINNNIKNKPEVYTLTLTKGTLQKDKNIIKKIDCLGSTEQYVYDLETDNHHFQAGIGEMIVHNTDGSHIKGLVMNMFHSTWPALLKREGFFTTMNTPIVKATKGKTILQFYNLTDYEEWKKENNNGKGYYIKYYKGLGTSDSKEAKEYFQDIAGSTINYTWDENASKQKGKTVSDDALELAFSKELADRRKQWLINYDRNQILDSKDKQVPIPDFIHKDLIHFSNDDTQRSIPSLVDGFKPSQRKIFYGAHLRGLEKDQVKVAQLAGFVSDRVAYHHGEASLMGAIIGMAQNFVGSNNLNVLEPKGQFGTRLSGKDHASPRYIWTKLEKVSSLVFRKEDNPILNYLNDDGQMVEPDYFLPIIPMILVNGATGIGTGFSTSIPCYNPIDLIYVLKNMIKGEKYKKIHPYYNKFTGKIKKLDAKSYEVRGLYKTDEKKGIVEVTELPIGEWTSNYKQYLEKMLDNDPNFTSYNNNSTDEIVSIKLKFKKIPKGLETKLKMVKKINLTNLHAYTSKGNIQKFKNIDEIILEFYGVRLEGYYKRKEYLLNIYKHQMDLISYKVKFIKEIIAKTLKINNRKRLDIESKLEDKKYPKMGKSLSDDLSYDYLLGMNLYSLTREKIAELEKQKKEKEDMYTNLKKKKPEVLWEEELDELNNFLLK